MTDILPAALEFQSDATRIDERRPPRLARSTLYVLLLVIAIAILWMSLASVDRIVVAPGKLVTTAQPIVLQPLTTAVVRTLNAQPGDVVHKGQTLATLDPTFSEADAGRLKDKVASLGAEIDRLGAELEKRPYQPTTKNSDTQLQMIIWAHRREEVEAKLDAFEQKLRYTTAQIDRARTNGRALGLRLTVAQALEAMRSTLYKKQLGSKINLLEAQGQRLGIQREMADSAKKVVELRQEYKRIQAERAAYLAQYRQKTAEQLVKDRSDYDSAVKLLDKARRQNTLTVLTAPQDAIVLDEAKLSVGSVAKEAQPIYTLVPLDSPLEAEVHVDGRDVGHVRDGELVKIKLEAWPFQDHGTLAGRVRTLSDDSFEPQKGTNGPPFYKARIRLGKTRLRNVPTHFRLIPGMAVTAEIKAGDRTVLSYFLYPLLRGLDESIREP